MSGTTPHDVTLTKAQQRDIHVVTVEPVSYHITLTTPGVVDFDHDRATRILAPFSGAVTRVMVNMGEEVHAGQALAEVDSPDFSAAAGAYRKAVLTAEAADSVAANDRVLYAHQAISQRETAAAQAAAAGADADRAATLQTLVALHMDARTIAAIRAGKRLAHRPGVIRAPIAGIVVGKSIAPGQTLTPDATPCFTIADTSQMWVMAQIFGADIKQVQVGDSATIGTGNGGAPVIGTVTNVGAVVESATRSVTARVSVTNPNDTLRKGMFVTTHIRSRAERTGLLVPVAAVLRNEEDLPFVYLLTEDGGYARRRIKLGPRTGSRYVIPQGLQAGDKLVADGGLFLRFIQNQ